MTKYYQCDECRKTSSEHELVWIDKERGSPMCRHCWGFVSHAFAAVDQPEPSLGCCDGCDELEAEENKTTIEAVEGLKKDCADHWEMIKARVFITLFLVWVCFAVWGKYAIGY